VKLNAKHVWVLLAAFSAPSTGCSAGLGASEGEDGYDRRAPGAADDASHDSEGADVGDRANGDDPTGADAPGDDPADGPDTTSDGSGAPSGGPGSSGGGTPEDGEPTTPSPGTTPQGTDPLSPGLGALPSFTCDTTLEPTEGDWRRLTRQQYENTVRDLLRFALREDGRVMSVYSDLSPELEALPSDERPKVSEDLKGTFRRLDQGVAQAHVDHWYQLGVQLGGLLTSGDNLQIVVGDCAIEDGGVDACVDAFVRRFGERVLRRPLSDMEAASFADFYGDRSAADPAGYADVIAGLLNAPEFLYLIEHGGDPAQDRAQVFELSSFELASRLSYHFWDTMPDDELWQTAADGTLLQDAVLQAQTDRLLGDPRAQRAIRNFFREWLKLENLGPLDQANDQPIFQAFAGDDQPSAVLRDNMMNEVLDLMDTLNAQGAGSFDALFTTQLIAPKTADLARLYGVDPTDTPFEAPNGDRPGLFTRAAFLATGSANTRPIQKGVFLRQNVLCDAIPPPPANAAATTPELDPEFTTREVVEALTEGQGTACQGCHQIYINPLGFATENYDGLGRVRAEQTLFDEEGNVVGSKAVETQSTPQVQIGDTTTINNAEELMQLMLSSGKAHACLARQYFRYSFGRWEDLAQDGCELERLREGLTQNGSISGMLRAVALSPEFRQRTIYE
jgi:Protein of unknown function (DUF1592)/Protein of unknown function (DUF1588)/Protein of unknown function (DUF1595)/Protein of unknown function (DUF1585)/Protein of unknown function (DUF1587)